MVNKMATKESEFKAVKLNYENKKLKKNFTSQVSTDRHRSPLALQESQIS